MKNNETVLFQDQLADEIALSGLTPESKEDWLTKLTDAWDLPYIQQCIKDYEQSDNSDSEDEAEERLAILAKRVCIWEIRRSAQQEALDNLSPQELEALLNKKQLPSPEDNTNQLLPLTTNRANNRTKPPPGDVLKLTETSAEIECRTAANEYLKIAVSSRSDVKMFRQWLPDGQFMNMDQAIDFLALPLCRYFEFKQLEEWNVCPSAETRLVSIQVLTGATGAYMPIHQWLDQMSIDRLLQPTVAITVSMTTRDGKIIEKKVDHSTKDYLVLAQGNSHKTYISDSHYVRPLWMKNATNAQFGMPLRTAEGFRRSIVGEALLTSERISRAYGWNPMGALFFLLTGEIVHDQGSLFASTRQVLLPQDEVVWGATAYTLLPWVSLSSMKKLHMIVGRKHGNKPMPTERNVRIFRFVNQQRSNHPEISWKELIARWCEQEGEGAKTPSINLSRDYDTAKKSLFPARNDDHGGVL